MIFPFSALMLKFAPIQTASHPGFPLRDQDAFCALEKVEGDSKTRKGREYKPGSEMKHKTEKFEFENQTGEKLAGRLELPHGTQPRAYALFAHCFTCGKDLAGASRICRGLAKKGIAVLRFDFTGIGGSDGDFANTDFSSNVEDLVSAALALEAEHEFPRLWIGHSLGGTAVLSAAGEFSGKHKVEAVATIGAPSDPSRVLESFGSSLEEIKEKGEAEVDLGGRSFKIKKRFIEDVTEKHLLEDLPSLGAPLLLFHSPVDSVVNIEHARKIYEAAKHPKNFISLDQADHLLRKKEDAEFVADTLAGWVGRYLRLETPGDSAKHEIDEGTVLVQERGTSYTQEVFAGRHFFFADEPTSVEGALDLGPSPYDLLLSALGSCTCMTIRMYAERKKIPLERARVRLRHENIHAEDCRECETEEGTVSRLTRRITLEGGDLSDEQKQKLLDIAGKCPVHRTLETEILIETNLS